MIPTNDYLAQFVYGDMEVNADNIDVFWLEGNSRITPFQQIDFLNRFYKDQLPITKRTEAIMKKMMVIEDSNHYRVSGKTGWSVSDGHDNGWFVGYVEQNEKVYFFATNIVPKEQFDMALFAMTRKEITYKALKQMGVGK